MSLYKSLAEAVQVLSAARTCGQLSTIPGIDAFLQRLHDLQQGPLPADAPETQVWLCPRGSCQPVPFVP